MAVDDVAAWAARGDGEGSSSEGEEEMDSPEEDAESFGAPVLSFESVSDEFGAWERFSRLAVHLFDPVSSFFLSFFLSLSLSLSPPPPFFFVFLTSIALLHIFRGMGSKLMAKMGYEKGRGLGRLGNGRLEPVPVKVLPPGASLDYCADGSRRKRRRQRQRQGRAGSAPQKPVTATKKPGRFDLNVKMMEAQSAVRKHPQRSQTK